jgi:hypothetical protein
MVLVYPTCPVLDYTLATSVDIPKAGSGCVTGSRNLVWLIGQLLHFHQCQCVLAPLPVMFCYTMRVLPGIDCSPRIIGNLSGNCLGPGWLTVGKNIDVPTCIALLCMLLLKRLAYISAWNTEVWSLRLKLCRICNIMWRKTWIWSHCHLTVTSSWLDFDMIQCHDACCALLNIVLNTTSCWKVLQTNECTIYCGTCGRNVVFWD